MKRLCKFLVAGLLVAGTTLGTASGAAAGTRIYTNIDA